MYGLRINFSEPGLITSFLRPVGDLDAARAAFDAYDGLEWVELVSMHKQHATAAFWTPGATLAEKLKGEEFTR